jgi:2,3-bisphosphoglycerate-dependent phosphoglycerate mutase
MTTFYLVRHAHADWSPDEDRPLSARGRADADRVADILAQYPIRAIYASPYRRAIETIAPLASRLHLPVNIEPDLRERRLGDSAATDFTKAVEATWRDPNLAHQGGETNATAQQRGLAVVRRLQGQHGAEQVVLSTHGNLLALILQGFDPSVGFAFWQSLTMPDIYLLSLNGAGEAALSRLWDEKAAGGTGPRGRAAATAGVGPFHPAGGDISATIACPDHIRRS